MRKKSLKSTLFIAALLVGNVSIKAASITEATGPEELSSTLQILVLLTFLTLLPSIVLTMTSFTRTIITFSLLRNGLGTQTTPPNQVLIGIALFLTFFIMAPVIDEMKTEALDPYSEGIISQDEFVVNIQEPIKQFMLKNTRSKDLELFVGLSDIDIPETADELPLYIIIPSFILSELKTAFEIGFLILIPFIVIDFIVSSVLLSMGMMMLPPVLISLPFKILLFVLIDGWYLVVQSLVESFAH
ncbi:MAG TPA: flagellar biosynthetic protein FliP [Firmicutes bacterium]|nr:flagellar biosynthetic protein FliP [Bacillota bacterium]